MLERACGLADTLADYYRRNEQERQETFLTKMGKRLVQKIRHLDCMLANAPGDAGPNCINLSAVHVFVLNSALQAMSLCFAGVAVVA
jgi:hypothetical protein